MNLRAKSQSSCFRRTSLHYPNPTFTGPPKRHITKRNQSPLWITKVRWSVSAILSKVKKSAEKKKILFWIQSFYPANMDFIIRQCCFITLDLKLLLRIQNSYSGSKVFTLDLK